MSIASPELAYTLLFQQSTNVFHVGARQMRNLRIKRYIQHTYRNISVCTLVFRRVQGFGLVVTRFYTDRLAKYS